MKTSAFLIAMLVGTLSSGSVAQGQRLPLAPAGITVRGTGQVAALPNRVEIDVAIHGSGPLTDDAITKFREARKRAMDAFAKLKLKNLTIEQTGVSIGAALTASQIRAMMQGNDQPKGKTNVEVTGSLRLTLTGIDKLDEEKVMATVGNLLDVARDSGSKVGISSAYMRRMGWGGYDVGDGRSVSTRYVLHGFHKQRELAYQRAMDDARRRAQRLARLSGRKLGVVRYAAEADVTGDDDEYAQYRRYAYDEESIGSEPITDEPRMTASRYAPIAVRVRLTVQFELLPQEKLQAKGRGVRSEE